MNSKNLILTFKVKKSVDEAFDALIDVASWWGQGIKGTSRKKGDKFDYKHKEFHTSTQTVSQFKKNQKLVWMVSNSKINFVKDKSEWENTEVEFLVEKDGAETKLTLIHHGLTPKLECYKNCSGGWEHYFCGSLKKLIETGVGDPDPKSFGK